MTALALDIASWILILLGSAFVVIGAFGMLRMPDVFTRMHAGGVVDTLGMGFLVIGMMLQAGLTLVTLKLVFVLALFIFTTPVVAHALAQACLHEGIEPILSSDRRSRARTEPQSKPGSEP